jgi:hypothetical protein
MWSDPFYNWCINIEKGDDTTIALFGAFAVDLINEKLDFVPLKTTHQEELFRNFVMEQR